VTTLVEQHHHPGSVSVVHTHSAAAAVEAVVAG
jgi:hypothetical protein